MQGQIWRLPGHEPEESTLIFESPSIDVLNAPPTFVSSHRGLLICEDVRGWSSSMADADRAILQNHENVVPGRTGGRVRRSTFSP